LIIGCVTGKARIASVTSDIMLAANQIKERFVPGLVGVALLLALFVNVTTKRNMCHDTGRSFEASQIASTLRD
jgi:hypothetical protein